MATAYTVMDQGSTLSWTHSYGLPSQRHPVQEFARDAAFALAVLTFVGGLAGFLTLEKPVAQHAHSAASRPAL